MLKDRADKVHKRNKRNEIGPWGRHKLSNLVVEIFVCCGPLIPLRISSRALFRIAGQLHTFKQNGFALSPLVVRLGRKIAAVQPIKWADFNPRNSGGF
jgi:hypothetical protein